MQHTIESLIRRINVMHDKSIELHRLRNQYSEISGQNYDKAACKVLIDDMFIIVFLKSILQTVLMFVERVKFHKFMFLFKLNG